MSTLKKIETKLKAIHRQEHELNLEKMRLHERQRMATMKLTEQRKEELAATTGVVDVYHSDDYAGLQMVDYHFSYGYEYTKCKKHGADCENETCEENGNLEWAFVAWKNGDEICRFGTSELLPCVDDENQIEVMEGLLTGIGAFLHRILEGTS